MGIELLSAADAQRGTAGRFQLPVGFNEKKWAASWVAKRDVNSKQQRQHLLGAGATADGWTVYKGEDGDEKITEVEVSEGKFVLMIRPRDVQNAVNAIFGNVGKVMADNERRGNTVAGAALQDAGMLPESKLRQVIGAAEEDPANEAQFKATPIPGVSGEHVSRVTPT